MAFVITKRDLYEIVKKTKLETIAEEEEPDNTDGKGMEEAADELIIENEAETFIILFEKAFAEETTNEEIDSEDGIVQDILTKVTLKIKEKIESTESNSIGLRLLRLLFIFIESLTRKEMAKTRAVPWRRPANINFNLRRVAAAKEIAIARERRNNLRDIKIKFVLPQGKNVEVKQRENVVKRMRVRRRAIDVHRRFKQ